MKRNLSQFQGSGGEKLILEPAATVTELVSAEHLAQVQKFYNTFEYSHQIPLPGIYENMKELSQKIYFVRGESDEVFGFVYLIKQEIKAILVQEKTRAQGIGRKLVDQCISFLAGKKHLVVHTYSSGDATAFWRSMGFRKYNQWFYKNINLINIPQILPEGRKIQIDICLGPCNKNNIEAVINHDGIYFDSVILYGENNTETLNVYHDAELILTTKPKYCEYIRSELLSHTLSSFPRKDGDPYSEGATAKMIDAILDKVTNLEVPASSMMQAVQQHAVVAQELPPKDEKLEGTGSRQKH